MAIIISALKDIMGEFKGLQILDKLHYTQSIKSVEINRWKIIHRNGSKYSFS